MDRRNSGASSLGRPPSVRGLVKQGSSASFSPGRSTNSLLVRQASGADGLGRGHASWTSEEPLPMPSGPPHIGKRDDMLRENKAMFAQLQSRTFEVNELRQAVGEVEYKANSAALAAADARDGLESQIEELSEALASTRKAAAAEEARLNHELSLSQAELEACSTRLAKTQEALGITDDKLRMIESSRGRLQIDLDGTLTSLEEASRKHHDDAAAAEETRVRREAELLLALEQSQAHAAMLAGMVDEARGQTASVQEVLEQTRNAGEAERLRLKHELDRMTDRLEASEAMVLDPSVLRNVKFATVKVRRVPDAAWMPLGGSGNLRGRLQNMVPPTMSEMASPAPTHGGMAAARPASRSVAWRGPGVGMK